MDIRKQVITWTKLGEMIDAENKKIKELKNKKSNGKRNSELYENPKDNRFSIQLGTIWYSYQKKKPTPLSPNYWLSVWTDWLLMKAK